MAVQEEQFPLSELEMTGISPEVVTDIYRRADGYWICVLKVDFEVTLPDGRRVRWNRHVNIPHTEQVKPRVASA